MTEAKMEPRLRKNAICNGTRIIRILRSERISTHTECNCEQHELVLHRDALSGMFHKLRLWAHLCVVISENSSGPMKLPPPKAKKELSLRAACDLDLAWGIIKSAR